MANEMKACCGGFLVGEGLTMEGKVLKATGGAGGCNFYTVEINGDVPSWAGGGTIPFMTFVVATEATFTNKEEFISYLEDEGFLYMISTFRGGAYYDDDGDYTIFNAYIVNTGDSGISVEVNCISDSDGSAHSYDLPIYPDSIQINITAKP